LDGKQQTPFNSTEEIKENIKVEGLPN